MRSTMLASLWAIIVLGMGLTMAEHSIDSAQAAGQDDIVAVKAVIHETAERWNSQDFLTVLELWDPDQEVPFYLAEEQDDWFIGWEPLRAYLDPPRPSPVVEGLREEMYEISVKLVADDLAIAAWRMAHAFRNENTGQTPHWRGCPGQRGHTQETGRMALYPLG